MEERVLRLSVSKIQEQIDIVVESLVDGTAKDYAEYKELCGAIRGLRTAQRELNDLVEKLKEADDD